MPFKSFREAFSPNRQTNKNMIYDKDHKDLAPESHPPPSYNMTKQLALNNSHQMPEWIDKMNVGFSVEEFSEFFVEMVMKYNDHLQSVVRPGDKIKVHVIEGPFNTHWSQTFDVQLGDLTFQLEFDYGNRHFKSRRPEFEIYVFGAMAYSDTHLKMYKHWLKTIRKHAPYSPIIMYRSHINTSGVWQKGIQSGQKKDVFDDLIKMTTIQLDHSHDDVLDNSNTLYKVLARCAMLQLMNQRTRSEQSLDWKRSAPAVPKYNFIERKFSWDG